MTDTVTKRERSRIMAAVKSQDTTPEMIVRRLIHSLGYRYRLHVAALPGTPDIVFPRLKKVINVSGCFWHMHSCGRCRVPVSRRRYWIGKLRGNAARDNRNRRLLTEAGWELLVVWECETGPSCSDGLQAKIGAFLNVDT